ncbi:MAG: hypothetical protein HN341_08350 [Verrucomicrobia bacterium]|nr:hypothetical protein [Verrucomicrobiota bacterium]
MGVEDADPQASVRVPTYVGKVRGSNPRTPSRRRERGKGKPDTFDYLGFTHICGKTREGRFMIKRITIRKRLSRKLREIKEKLTKRMHRPLSETGRWADKSHAAQWRLRGLLAPNPASPGLSHSVYFVLYPIPL